MHQQLSFRSCCKYTMVMHGETGNNGLLFETAVKNSTLRKKKKKDKKNLRKDSSDT